MRSRWIQVRVSDDEHAALTRRAEAQKMTVAELVRTLAGEGSLPRRVQETAQRNGGSAQEPRREKPDLNPVSSPQGAQEAPAPPISSPPTQLPFRCKDPRCSYRAKSPAAKCNVHGYKVVPA